MGWEANLSHKPSRVNPWVPYRAWKVVTPEVVIPGGAQELQLPTSDVVDLLWPGHSNGRGMSWQG